MIQIALAVAIGVTIGHLMTRILTNLHYNRNTYRWYRGLREWREASYILTLGHPRWIPWSKYHKRHLSQQESAVKLAG